MRAHGASQIVVFSKCTVCAAIPLCGGASHCAGDSLCRRGVREPVQVRCCRVLITY